MVIELTPAVVIAAIAAGIGLANFVYTRFGVEIRTNERLTAVEVRVGLFMTVLDAQLKGLGLIVKAPTHYRMDYLVDRFESGEANRDEIYELRALLKDYQAELQEAYSQKKAEAVRSGAPLPDGARIVATALFLTMVELKIHEYEQHLPAQGWRWRHWFTHLV